MKERIFIIACLVIPLFLLVLGYSSFIYSAGSEYSDLTISHFPNLIFLKNALLETGKIPLWSNTILSGYPFAANPLSGIWYPFTWLLLILPQPFGFNFIINLHLFFGGLGIYLCLRKKGIHKYAAILGAVSFELMPKLVAHYAAGHLSLVYAVSLTPWLIYVEEIYKIKPKSYWRFISGLVLGVIALADIRWAPYAGILFIALRIDIFYHFHSISIRKISNNSKQLFIRIYGLVKEIALPVITAMGISSVVWLPLVQYSMLSTRSTMTVSDRLTLSLTPLRLLGLLIPDMQGYCEWAIYPGALGLISVLAILFSKKLRKKSTFWLVVLLISLLWSLGNYNPIMQYISALPGLSLLRVPARALFMVGIAFSILLGIFTSELLSSQPMNKGMKLAIAFICIFMVVLCIGVKVISHEWNIEFLWGVGACVLIGGFILIVTREKSISETSIFTIIFSLMILDLGIVNYLNMDFQSSESVINEKSELTEWLSIQTGQFRVYSPSYSIPQLAAAKSGLELADGIDPLRLQNYDHFMLNASGVPGEEYSVTLPRFETGTPHVDNKKYVPSTKLLGLLNIKFICSEFPISTEGINFVKEIDNTLIYENEYVYPRVWMQKTSTLTPGVIESYPNRVEAIEYEPDRIIIQTNGEEGILILSEMNYPGWIVSVDGNTTDMIAPGNLLRGVRIPAGNHKIEFKFCPMFVYFGGAISIFTLIILLFFIIKNFQNKEKYV